MGKMSREETERRVQEMYKNAVEIKMNAWELEFNSLRKQGALARIRKLIDEVIGRIEVLGEKEGEA